MNFEESHTMSSRTTALLATGFLALAIDGASANGAAATTAAPSPTATPNSAMSGSSGPISIADGCSYKTLRSGMNFGGPATIFGKGYNFFDVTFTNNSAVAADRIVFQIDFAKASRIVIPDVGTFAPGATIKQTFRDKGKEMVFSARPTPNDGSVICTVVSAHFVDNTSYTNPQAATPTSTP